MLGQRTPSFGVAPTISERRCCIQSRRRCTAISAQIQTGAKTLFAGVQSCWVGVENSDLWLKIFGGVCI